MVFNNILNKYLTSGNQKYWYDMISWCCLCLLKEVTDLKKRKKLYKILKDNDGKSCKL